MALVIPHDELRIGGEGYTSGALLDPTAEVGRDCYLDSSACVWAGARLGERVRLAAWSNVGENAEVAPGTLVDRGAIIGENAKVVNLTPEVDGHIPAYAVVPNGKTIEMENGVVRNPRELKFRNPSDVPPGASPERRSELSPPT